MTIFVNLFIESVIKKVTTVTNNKRHLTLNIVFSVLLVALAKRASFKSGVKFCDTYREDDYAKKH